MDKKISILWILDFGLNVLFILSSKYLWRVYDGQSDQSVTKSFSFQMTSSLKIRSILILLYLNVTHLPDGVGVKIPASGPVGPGSNLANDTSFFRLKLQFFHIFISFHAYKQFIYRFNWYLQ